MWIANILTSFKRRYLPLAAASQLLIAALICLCASQDRGLREGLNSFTEGNPTLVAVLSMLGILTALILLQVVQSELQRRKFQLVLDPNNISIEVRALEGYLNCYWEGLFPAEKWRSHVQMQANGLTIDLHLPARPRETQRSLLARIESDLSDLLDRTIGYRRPVILMVQFAD